MKFCLNNNNSNNQLQSQTRHCSSSRHYSCCGYARLHEEEYVHEVHIHPYLPLMGAFSAAVLACFTAVVVILPTSVNTFDADTNNGTSLKYISIGMKEHCGWSGLVFGTTGSLVGISDLVPAIHVGRTDVVLCLLAQLVCWNMVLGVSETGWDLHYVALAGFCISNLYFNYVMSRSREYGSHWYRLAHGASFLIIVIFTAAFCTTAALSGQDKITALNVTVTIEFLLMCAVTANTLLLMLALSAYDSIFLVLSRVQPTTVAAAVSTPSLLPPSPQHPAQVQIHNNAYAHNAAGFWRSL